MTKKSGELEFFKWAFQLRGESGKSNRTLFYKILGVCFFISILYTVLLLGVPQFAASMPGSSNLVIWLTWVGPSNLIWNLITIIPLAIIAAIINSAFNIDIIEMVRPWVDWVAENPSDFYVFWIGNLYVVGLMMITFPTVFWTFFIYSVIQWKKFRKLK